MSNAAPSRSTPIRAWPLLAACGAFVAAKVWLIYRLNMNWDEFNFLSHVFESTRGDLRLLLQGAFVHAFTWLTRLGGNEADLVVAGRFVMVSLLAMTACLLWLLACRWVSRPIALMAVLCYLSTLPVLTHGGSFRYDSLLAPLLLASILCAASGESRRNSFAAAIAFGLGGAISVKMLLFAPLLAATILLRTQGSGSWSAARATFAVVSFGALALATAAAALFAHSLTISADSYAVGGFAQVGIRTMLLDVPWIPRLDVLEATLRADPVVWSLIAAGSVCAAAQSKYRTACACALSLLPILFYRNAWPYFYVLMLAPACVLAAVAIETFAAYLAARNQVRAAAVLALGIGGVLVARGAVHAVNLSDDLQSAQRAAIEAVHEIFPEPVPYVDHSGMISSFPKANFFMSTWGIERYRAAGIGFMDDAIARHRPQFVLANRSIVNVWMGGGKDLLDRDRELLLKHYVPYWGLVHVAGAELAVTSRESAIVDLPFPGRYRLEATQPVVIDGVRRQPGEEFEVALARVSVASPLATDTPTDAAAAGEPSRARLVTAAAREIRHLSSSSLQLMMSSPIYVLL